MNLISVPPLLRRALDGLRDHARPRLVGGCVRDALLGRTPVDFDVEVGGISFARLHAILAPLGATDVVGRSFGVIKLRDGAATYDFSLPRRESKIGAGHRGFSITPDPTLSDAEAAARRDFTVNAIAWDPFTAAIIDPLDGQHDLKAGLLRHASDAFGEDPLRVLRAMQFAARFRFSLAPETIEVARAMKTSFGELPVERIWQEWDKWATTSVEPSRGLAVLAECGWLEHFPEIFALADSPQDPTWHPEGNVFAHTQHCLDALTQSSAWISSSVSRRRLLTFGVLAHDFGKPATTLQTERDGELRWVSPGHESAGLAPTLTFLRGIGAPLDLIPRVQALVQNHLVHHHTQTERFSAKQIRRLARRLSPATINDLAEVMAADARGRPPLDPQPSLDRIAELRRGAESLALTDEAPQPIILGRHLLAAGLPPSPDFKPLLAEAFEAQLDGAFTDSSTAQRWLENRLRV